MAATGSVDVLFDRAPAQQIGSADGYLGRPGFWHGGAGIAACWHGGAVGVARALLGGRREPHADAHRGAVDAALAASAAHLRAVAALLDGAPHDPHEGPVRRMRATAEATATLVLDRAGRALGAAPLCRDAAHAGRVADLTVFLRQSHAERDLEAVGAAADGTAWDL